MKKFLLDYNLKVRLPIILFVAAAVFAITYYTSFAERNNVGYQPEQPIAYSHKLHAGDMKIDCRYCHYDADKSKFANVPSADVCMNCHAVVKKDSPEIQKLTKYYEEDRPIPWKRVHKVPDFVYFPHNAHIGAGVACVNCHGNIEQMEVVGQVRAFTMAACLDCHKDPQKNITSALQPPLMMQYSKTVSDVSQIKPGPQNCSACHR